MDIGYHNRNRIVDSLCSPGSESGNFIYMVHGVNRNILRSDSLLRERLQDLRTSDFRYNASLVGNLGDVSQMSMMNPAGIMVKPRPEDIYVAWYEDLSTPTNQGSLRKWVDQHKGKILGPREIINFPHRYFTHLVLGGNPEIEIQSIVARENTPPEYIDSITRVLSDEGITDLPITTLRPRYPFWMLPESDIPIKQRMRTFQECKPNELAALV